MSTWIIIYTRNMQTYGRIGSLTVSMVKFRHVCRSQTNLFPSEEVIFNSCVYHAHKNTKWVSSWFVLLGSFSVVWLVSAHTKNHIPFKTNTQYRGSNANKIKFTAGFNHTTTTNSAQYECPNLVTFLNKRLLVIQLVTFIHKT